MDAGEGPVPAGQLGQAAACGDLRAPGVRGFGGGQPPEAHRPLDQEQRGFHGLRPGAPAEAGSPALAALHRRRLAEELSGVRPQRGGLVAAGEGRVADGLPARAPGGDQLPGGRQVRARRARADRLAGSAALHAADLPVGCLAGRRPPDADGIPDPPRRAGAARGGAPLQHGELRAGRRNGLLGAAVRKPDLSALRLHRLALQREGGVLRR